MSTIKINGKTTFLVLKLQGIIFLDLTQALFQIMNKTAEESYQNTGGKFHCDSCNHVTTRFESLKAHKLAKHEGLVYNCDNCDFKTAYKSCLERHKLKHGEKKFSCDQCHFKATLSDTKTLYTLESKSNVINVIFKVSTSRLFVSTKHLPTMG